MRNHPHPARTTALLRKPRFTTCLLLAAFAAATSLPAQRSFIAADSLTPFHARDVGTVSEVKTVRIQLRYPRALASIAVAPGFDEFTRGAVTGCALDGRTPLPALSVCSVEVTFSPKYPGLRTAPLIVTDSAGGNASVGLEGTGLAPQAALTPGIVSTVAGNGQFIYRAIAIPRPRPGANSQTATSVPLAPEAVAVDTAGNLYITGRYGAAVRKVDPQGIITWAAGSGSFGFGGDGGPADHAYLAAPTGVAVDAAGNLYVADADNSRIRKVNTQGIITTVAGNGSFDFGGDGGPATQASLNLPNAVAVDAAGNLYIADTRNHRIRKVNPAGVISTVAGTGTAGFNGDHALATAAMLNGPNGVAADAEGALYIADSGNHRVRKVNQMGVITTVAGTGTAGFSGDGNSAIRARLSYPVALAFDAAGGLYIADRDNARIRRVDVHGWISTIAGIGPRGVNGCEFTGDGGPATSSSMCASGIAVDSAGNLYVADFYNYRVRKIDVSRSAADFSAPVGSTSKVQRLIVTNSGNQHLDLYGLNTTGDFHLLAGDNPSYCSSTPDIGAGFSCALPITFTPAASGARTGSAIVTDNSLSMPGSTQSVTLRGTATNP